VSTLGIFANFADDIRHLQRTEISEVEEGFTDQQVGSSTMPHKRNPWNLEHVKSLWKEFTPRLQSVLQNQISEHQRDLTNSASSRFLPEIYVGFADAVDRLLRVCSTLRVRADDMKKNLAMSAGYVAEHLYILLSLQGLQDAHRLAQRLSFQAQEQGRSVFECALADQEIVPYLQKLTPEQVAVLRDPALYTGVSERKTHEICDYWETTLALNKEGLAATRSAE
jgi:adenylosuccinate lyase